jgi:hypothetical protein
VGHPGLAIDRFGPEQEDLRHDRGLAQSADRGLAPVKSGRSLSGALKRARAALWTYGDPKKRTKAVEALDDELD